MKLKVIVPVTTKEFIGPTRKEAEKFASEGTEIDVECIEHGMPSIESAYDEMVNGWEILRVAQKAEKEGFDGVFISCMGDPALDAAREILNIPVVGPARASMAYAAELAHRFSIVTVLENVVPLEENLAELLGVREKLASVRYVNIPVLELEDKNKLVSALVEESLKAIKEDRAQAIVLGCTGMLGVSDSLSSFLKEKGYDIPVIYPVAVAIKYLETLVSLGLKQSKKSYMQPPQKEVG
jgi:allantoin racemase